MKYRQWWRLALPALAGTLTFTALGCGATEGPTLAAAQAPTTVTQATEAAQPTAEPTPSPTPLVRPPAPNGRTAPPVPITADALAQQLTDVERGLRDPSTTATLLAELGHRQQVLYRKLGRQPDWDRAVLSAIPADLAPIVELQTQGRRALTGLASGFDAADFVPAWEIVEPAPAEALLGFYKEAEEATGVQWEFLASINLLETGLGRIVGLSGAGAQGPMQFLPTTWEEVGQGDINNPHDAIVGAARYLVHRGGPDDMAAALYGYNNSDHYVASVTAYAELLMLDPEAFTGLYNWEIYFFTDAGDIWLPVGYRSEEPLDVDDYIATAPWSTPDLAMLGAG